MADLGPGTMPRGKYPESPAPAGSHALISRTPTPGGMLHANLGLPRPPPRNFQPPLRQQPPKQTQQRRHNVPPVQSLRDSAAATPVGCAAWRRRFRIFSFRYREMMSGMTMIFLTVMFFPPGILSQAREWSFGAVPSQERRHEEVLDWGIVSHALHRPTHAPATTLKTNGNSAPIKPMSFPSSGLGMRPAKLRFAFPLPQSPPEQTQPLPQGGLAFPSELRGNSFTPSPVQSLRDSAAATPVGCAA